MGAKGSINNPPSAIVEIATDGDVILVVGPDKVKLCVHSLFLKSASKVFSAMFKPNFSEGHDVSGRDGSREVLLPDDDAGALKIICVVIHHQNCEVPEPLGPREALGVVIAADKYDCVDVLKYASGNWLQRREKEEAADLLLLTVAAYLLRNVQAFKETTRTLILNHNASYSALTCEEVEGIIPWRLFCLLEEQRSRVRLELQDILLGGTEDATCGYNCGWSSKHAYAYLSLLKEEKLWPRHMLKISISQALNIMENMPDPVPKEPSIDCSHDRWHRDPKYRQSRGWKLDDLNKVIGLCLSCVKSGSATTSFCRIQHQVEVTDSKSSAAMLRCRSGVMVD